MGFLRKYVFPILFGVLLFPIFRIWIPRYKILNVMDTIKYLIVHEEKSLIRYGDGEFDILFGRRGPHYQMASDDLRDDLFEILKNPDVLLAIPGGMSISNLERNFFSESQLTFWRSYLVRNLRQLEKVLDVNFVYGDSLISRPYSNSFNKDFAKKYFNEIKLLWKGKRVLIIEGELTRFGIGNDLMASATDVRRVVGPASNAYEKVEKILEEIKKIEDVDLYILALGPAGKIIANEISKFSRALDLGHLDIEYEWYLRGATYKISIPNKFVNESKVHYVEGEFDSKLYDSQVVAKVL